ncbi:MAG: HIT family protein [Planctomycetes bacterium]|nr:HIT family protein [Planctomycetota bacterium]
MADDCPFCSRIALGEIGSATRLSAAFPDAFPLAEGHTLVVSRRCVASYFDLDADEQRDLWELVARVRASLSDSLDCDGWNVGINDGVSAGQTVAHVHVHLIPRRRNDVPDPRGGVRWVLPARAAWWRAEREA